MSNPASDCSLHRCEQVVGEGQPSRHAVRCNPFSLPPHHLFRHLSTHMLLAVTERIIPLLVYPDTPIDGFPAASNSALLPSPDHSSAAHPPADCRCSHITATHTISSQLLQLTPPTKWQHSCTTCVQWPRRIPFPPPRTTSLGNPTHPSLPHHKLQQLTRSSSASPTVFPTLRFRPAERGWPISWCAGFLPRRRLEASTSLIDRRKWPGCCRRVKCIPQLLG